MIRRSIMVLAGLTLRMISLMLYHVSIIQVNFITLQLNVLMTLYFSVLRLGELFHDELFGLFEAMSAIEMMDPKMDAGMLCNRGGKPTLNFEQALSVIF